MVFTRSPLLELSQHVFAQFLESISTDPWPDTTVSIKTVLLLHEFMSWITTSLSNVLSDSESTQFDCFYLLNLHHADEKSIKEPSNKSRPPIS